MPSGHQPEFEDFVARDGTRRTAADIEAAGIFWQDRRRRHRRIAAGVVSVTAAAGLVAGVLIANSGSPAPTRVAQASAHRSGTPTRSAQPGTGQPSGNPLLTAPPRRPLSAKAADAGMPRYYIIAASKDAAELQVRSSATGKVVSAFAPPAGCEQNYHMAAAGNDRDFALSCETSQKTVLYRLRITSGGRATAFRALSLPSSAANAWADDMALTPDGSKLAIGFQDYGKGGGAIDVVTLATGAVRTWTTASPFNLSWADHGRELGFWNGALWVLNVSAAGKPTSAHKILSRQVGSDDVDEAMLNPDGTTIIASVTYEQSLRAPLRRGEVVGGIAEINARTGKPLHTLLAEHAHYSVDGGGSEAGWYVTNCLLGPADSTGNHLLVSCDRFGRLDRGRFTALPGQPAESYFAAAW